MGRNYDKLHFALRRHFDKLSPGAHRRLLFTLLIIYGLLSCYFIAQFFVHPKKQPVMEKLIDQSIQTDSLFIYQQKQLSNHDNKRSE